MTSSVENKEILATGVRIEADRFYLLLEDGRELGVPYHWFWRLERATPEQRKNWELIADGYGIHWPDVDEDILVEAVLRGERTAEKPPAAPARQTQ